jgi:hypothetical protein
MRRWKKCDVGICKESGTEQMLLSSDCQNNMYSNLSSYCYGHAFLIMGQYPQTLFIQCPRCHLYVGRDLHAIEKAIKEKRADY